LALVSKAEVERRLGRLGAFWAADMDDDHQLWTTTWGFEIWVPIAKPNADMWEADLVEIEDEIRKSRPKPSP
jgi:hypothetical protein